MIKKAARMVFPAGSRQRIFAGKIKSLVLERTLGGTYKYRDWIKKIEPNILSPILKKQKIKFSIVVPAYNTPEIYVKQLIQGVIEQTYGNWQLHIADGSTEEKTSELIKKYCDKDERIDCIKLSKNLGISGNTNQAIKRANGDFVAFLDHDDILPNWSLNELATAIQANPHAEVLYSDEDRLSEDGKIRLTPFFKPDWSPDLFLSANYLAHFFVIQKRFLDKLECLRSDFDGSQDYDLALRALDYNPNIIHIPKILYHMRLAKGSTARSINEKNYAHDAGKKAIEEYLRRNKVPAKVLEIPGRPTNHRIKYHIKNQDKVSIIIPFKDKVDLLQQCITSLLKRTSYTNYELILISNASKEPETFKYLESMKPNKNIKILDYNRPFNYSKINNFGRQNASGKVLVFLNNDTVINQADWLEELISVAQRSEIGAVGPLLYYPDQTIQHAGVILGLTGLAGHIFRNLKLGTLTPFWLPDWPRNYLAITGACLAVEAKKFDQTKGFNEEFTVAGSDVVFCLDLYKLGYRNIFWPFASLVHHESKSVGSYKNAPLSDYKLSEEYYKEYLIKGDPFFNPNLSLDSEIPELKRSL